MKKIYILLFTLSAAMMSSQNLASGLKACYPLNGNVQNNALTGSALDGTLHNVMTTNGHSNLANTAYQLNGSTSSYIELPDHPGLKSDSVFFSGWFRIDSLPSMSVVPSLQYLVYTTNGCISNFEAYSVHMSFDTSVNHYVFGLTKSDNTCSFGKPQIFSTTAPALGNWYHLCFYITNSVMKLWVNGVLESSMSHTTPFSYLAGYSVFLGVTNQSNFDYPFKGAIDNVRFYNRELTQQEITNLYTQDPVCYESTSIFKEDQLISQINVYPNPATDNIYIESLRDNNLMVLDVLGRPVKVIEYNESERIKRIVLEESAPGIYFINISDQQGNYLGSKKITILK